MSFTALINENLLIVLLITLLVSLFNLSLISLISLSISAICLHKSL
nr:MAG TPA: hypothetical protein [Caudoviricetes sp.]